MPNFTGRKDTRSAPTQTYTGTVQHLNFRHRLFRDGNNMRLQYQSPDGNDIEIIMAIEDIFYRLEDDKSKNVSMISNDSQYLLDYSHTTFGERGPENYPPLTSQRELATLIGQETSVVKPELLWAMRKIFHIRPRTVNITRSLTRTWEDLSKAGGNYPFPTANVRLEVVSSDANDTILGLGARTVFIEGHDILGERVRAIGELNGLGVVDVFSPVPPRPNPDLPPPPPPPPPAPVEMFRINELRVEEVGTYGGTNYGDLTVQVFGGGSILKQVTGSETIATSSYGDSIHDEGIQSTSDNREAYLCNISISVEGTDDGFVDIRLYGRQDTINVSTEMRPRRVLFAVDAIKGYVSRNTDTFIPISALTDYWWRARVSPLTLAGGIGREVVVNINYDVIGVIRNTNLIRGPGPPPPPPPPP